MLQSLLPSPTSTRSAVGVFSASIAWCYLGCTIGDFSSGALGQLLRSRLRVLRYFFGASAAAVAYFLFGLHGASVEAFYFACFLVGLAGGFWTLFVTVAAESFGTNIRATVATTAPNFARGSLVLVALLFKLLKEVPALGMVGAAALIGAVLLGLAFFSASTLPETYGKELDYVKEV